MNNVLVGVNIGCLVQPRGVCGRIVCQRSGGARPYSLIRGSGVKLGIVGFGPSVAATRLERILILFGVVLVCGISSGIFANLILLSRPHLILSGRT